MIFNTPQIKSRDYDSAGEHYRRSLQDGQNITFYKRTITQGSPTSDAYDTDVSSVESSFSLRCIVDKVHMFDKRPEVIGILEVGDITVSTDYTYIDNLKKSVYVVYEGNKYYIEKRFTNDPIEGEDPYEVVLACKLKTGR